MWNCQSHLSLSTSELNLCFSLSSLTGFGLLVCAISSESMQIKNVEASECPASGTIGYHPPDQELMVPMALDPTSQGAQRAKRQL